MADTEASREDRQLPASERRIRKAREDGRVARSRDLVHFAVLGAALAGGAAIGPSMARETIAMVRSALVFERETAMSAGRMPEVLASLGADAIGAALPLVAGLCAVAIAATTIPGGVVLSTRPLDFDLSRLAPSNGVKRVFSVRGASTSGGFWCSRWRLPRSAAGSSPPACPSSRAWPRVRWRKGCRAALR